MAKFAWISVPLCFGMGIFLQAGSTGQPTQGEMMGRAMAVGLLMLVGVVCGLIALCAIPKYGAKGLLAPALTGLVLWIGLAALAFPTYMKVRQNAEQVRTARSQRIDLTAVTHLPGAERLEDAELGFSFDIPAGYQAVPAASKPKQYRHLYGRPTAGETASVIAVISLPGAKLPTQHLTAASLPAGKGASLLSFTWRGLPVDAFRVSEPSAHGEFITFNVQIPLKKHTLQIGFGGPVAREAENRAIAIQTLSTLEGEPNWP